MGNFPVPDVSISSLALKVLENLWYLSMAPAVMALFHGLAVLIWGGIYGLFTRGIRDKQTRADFREAFHAFVFAVVILVFSLLLWAVVIGYFSVQYQRVRRALGTDPSYAST